MQSGFKVKGRNLKWTVFLEAATLAVMMGLFLFPVLSNLLHADPIEKNSTSSALIPQLDPEPSYCLPERFDELELPEGNLTQAKGKKKLTGLVRAHGFQLGKTILVGLGVGDSPVNEVIELASRFAKGKNPPPQYCTWYLNHPWKTENPLNGNRKQASATFVHRDIAKSPVDLSEEEAASSFMKALTTSFDQGSVNFLTCATEQNYLALGCNEMSHRGPTAVGMVLAFSGCTPAHSLEIVNQIWGLNRVKRKVRLNILQKAYELGKEHLNARKKLSEAFQGK